MPARKKKICNFRKVTKVTPDAIAQFLKLEYPDCNYPDLNNRTEFKSCATINSFWVKSCPKIYPCYQDVRSHLKWGRELYRCFNYRKEEVKEAFNLLSEHKVGRLNSLKQGTEEGVNKCKKQNHLSDSNKVNTNKNNTFDKLLSSENELNNSRVELEVEWSKDESKRKNIVSVKKKGKVDAFGKRIKKFQYNESDPLTANEHELTNLMEDMKFGVSDFFDKNEKLRNNQETELSEDKSIKNNFFPKMQTESDTLDNGVHRIENDE